MKAKTQLNIWKSADISWISGFFDAEGTVNCTGISQKDPTLLYIKDALGVGYVYPDRNSDTYNKYTTNAITCVFVCLCVFTYLLQPTECGGTSCLGEGPFHRGCNFRGRHDLGVWNSKHKLGIER
jgi:hypothetical protein